MLKEFPPIVDMKGLIRIYEPKIQGVDPWMTEGYIKKQVHLKTMPHIKKGKKLLFDPLKVDQWLREGEVETKDDLITSTSTSFFLKRKKK